MSTKPKLTKSTQAADEAARVSPPGAGGWTPKHLQVVLIGCLAAGITAALDLADAPDITPRALAVAAGKAVVVYLVAHFGMKSAGPRSLS